MDGVGGLQRQDGEGSAARGLAPDAAGAKLGQATVGQVHSGLETRAGPTQQRVGRPPAPGRAPGEPPGPQTGKKNSSKPTLSRSGGRHCAHNARRPSLFQNEGNRPFLTRVPRLLGFWGSMGLGGALLVHFFTVRCQVKKEKKKHTPPGAPAPGTT